MTPNDEKQRLMERMKLWGLDDAMIDITPLVNILATDPKYNQSQQENPDQGQDEELI